MKLSDLEHLKTDPRIKFKQEQVEDKTFTIVSYMIADPTLWNDPAALECRGVTFDENGNCVSRTFEKFFNISENPSTQINLVKDQVKEVTDKVDGSMITGVLVNDKIVFKTKKSFYSDVAITANDTAAMNVKLLSYEMARLGWTAIWEFCHPNHQIVIDYGTDPQFTLLALRNNLTGNYLERSALVKIADNFGVKLVKFFDLSFNEILNQVSELQDVEGYVLVLKDGSRVKIKTEWYNTNHRIMTCLRVRDVAELVVDELIDDTKSLLVTQGKDLTPVLEIERQVINELSLLVKIVTEVVERDKDLSIKDFAIKYEGDPMRFLYLQMKKGQEVSYKKFWKKEYLDAYTLCGVFNRNF